MKIIYKAVPNEEQAYKFIATHGACYVDGFVEKQGGQWRGSTEVDDMGGIVHRYADTREGAATKVVRQVLTEANRSL